MPDGDEDGWEQQPGDAGFDWAADLDDGQAPEGVVPDVEVGVDADFDAGIDGSDDGTELFDPPDAGPGLHLGAGDEVMAGDAVSGEASGADDDTPVVRLSEPAGDDGDDDAGLDDSVGDGLRLGIDDVNEYPIPADRFDSDASGDVAFEDPWSPSEPVGAVWGDAAWIDELDRSDWIDADGLPDAQGPSEEPAAGVEELDRFAATLWERAGGEGDAPASTAELLRDLAETSSDADIRVAAQVALEMYP